MRASYQNENQHVQEPKCCILWNRRKINKIAIPTQVVMIKNQQKKAKGTFNVLKVSLFAGSRQRLTD
jgi:hypothetical protein